MVRELPDPARGRVDVAVSPDPPPVCCDREQLHRAFKHLILNAVESLDDGGRVVLTVRRDGSRVVIEVQDSGRGVPEADQEHVFEPLFTTKARGAGLGLTVTRRIFEENGGGLELHRIPGDGSCFRAWLPCADGLAQQDQPALERNLTPSSPPDQGSPP